MNTEEKIDKYLVSEEGGPGVVDPKLYEKIESLKRLIQSEVRKIIQESPEQNKRNIEVYILKTLKNWIRF